MPLALKGVMQSPVTPLKEDFSPDLGTFERRNPRPPMQALDAAESERLVKALERFDALAAEPKGW